MATILVVEDEAPIREFLVMILTDLGHDVRTAINGREAMRMIAEERPDLVISDVMMPVVSGPELCRWLKTEVHPPPPVILTSSVDGHLAHGAGADAFVPKPFDLTVLERTVRSCVR